MTRSIDEPFTLYGLIAQSDRNRRGARLLSSFHLDPDARFADGAPITAADVLFTFDLLKTKGRPQQRAAYTPGAKRSTTPDDRKRSAIDFPGAQTTANCHSFSR